MTESPVQLEAQRRETLDALVEHLAEEHIGVEEFEERVRVARDATTPTDVREALAGLPGRGSAGAG